MPSGSRLVAVRRRAPGWASVGALAGAVTSVAAAARGDAGGRVDVRADVERTLAAQREAAREAERAVAAGDDPRVAALLGDASAWVRDATVAALVRRAEPARLAPLARLLEGRDDLVAPAAAEVLGRAGFRPARPALEAALLEAPAERTALAAAWALEALADPASAPALERAHARRPEPRARGDALVALAGVAPERARPLAARALAARDPALVIAGLEALRRLDGGEAAAAATALLGAREAAPRALFAALDALGGWADRDAARGAAAVEALVTRLERTPRDGGRLRADLARALADLTGQEGLGDDARAWRAWWSLARGQFSPAPPRGGPPGVGAPAASAGTTTRARFHGVLVESDRLLILQDVSGGMLGPIDPDAPAGPTRLRFALDELGRLLGALDPGVRLDVGLFATAPRRAAGRLVPVGPARRQLAAWAEREGRPPSGEGQARSNLHDTLAAALEDPDVDTVFLLSEGGPTEGRFVDGARVVEHLARRARYARVRVHCLQMTASRPGAELLRALAARLGGSFHPLAPRTARPAAAPAPAAGGRRPRRRRSRASGYPGRRLPGSGGDSGLQVDSGKNALLASAPHPVEPP